MILDITQSHIFKLHPDDRFMKEYSVPKGTWTECWKRYKLMGYSNSDIREFLFVRYARRISKTGIRRWVIRSEIYAISYPLSKKGVRHVNSNIFGKFEEELMKELVKQIGNGGTTHSKTII